MGGRMTSQPLDGWRGGYLRFHKSYVRSEPGPHMASSCDCRPNFVVYTRRIIGVVIQYRRTLERGMRSHDDPRSGVGALCDAFTGTCYHEAPSENTGPGLALKRWNSWIADGSR